MKKLSLATILTVLCSFFFTDLSAQYISSTTTQASTAPVYPGARKEVVLRVEVEIGTNPVTLTKMMFNTVGSTNPITDIINARLWFYNDSSALDTTLGLLIGTYNAPWFSNWTMMTASASYAGMTIFNGMIPSQKNYFWLTYDLNSNAILCDTIDGTFVEMIADGITYYPTVSSPSGYRVISPCVTGLEENMLKNVVTVFPVPCQDELTILNDFKENENITFDLYNVTGTKVATIYDGIVNDTFSEFKFSLTNFPPGVYYLNCISKSGVVVKRIVKV
ncbi:MAG TPA: T9SS type A sorting domain-containing protein [Bacteroidia bacterium]|nr:T9SS type A sorting domain-containing protein [Bacteroidia bacterium]